MTEEKLNSLLDDLSAERKSYFGKDEEIYSLLGKTMGRLMDIRDILRAKVRNGN